MTVKKQPYENEYTSQLSVSMEFVGWCGCNSKQIQDDWNLRWGFTLNLKYG